VGLDPAQIGTAWSAGRATYLFDLQKASLVLSNPGLGLPNDTVLTGGGKLGNPTENDVDVVARQLIRGAGECSADFDLERPDEFA
jgi:hypothetical protein